MLSLIVAALCFLLSGFAGLVYEVCWIRRASLVFGSTTFALSSVLAVFFGGLALGSCLAGRLAARTARPLRWYAGLEVALAALALASPFAFDLADAIYGPIYRALAGRELLLFGARVVLVALVLLPPTLLMGATLPLFCRQFVARESRIAATIGLLYGVNTLGAALGCAATGLWLLPHLGAGRAILLAAGLNLVAATAAYALRLTAPETRQKGPAPAKRGAPAATMPDAATRRRLIGWLFLTTGLVAVGAEVLWTRFLSLIVRNTVYTYTITLTVVLAGIVLGSLLAAWLADRPGSLGRARWFAGLQGVSALVVLLLMLLPVTFWRGLGAGPAPYIVLMLVPAAMSGALFPLANRLALDDPALAAASVGRLAALNTAGGIVGSLAVGFAALPLGGLAASVRLVTGLGLVAGATAWVMLGPSKPSWQRWAPPAAAAAIWLLLPTLLGTRLPADFLAPRHALVAFREGYASHLAVVRGKGALNLEIDRLWQGSDEKTHQIMAAHVPMLAHPNPHRVLVVGIGTGNTASRFLMYDIAHLDCVDIEPAIFPLVRAHFPSAWMDDPRVALIPEDGRSYLAHAAARYDVISIEVGQVFRPGVEAFYSEEFYRKAKQRLAPGGVISQFVPLPFFTVEELRGVVQTFRAVFPECVLWYNTSELLLLGKQSDRLAFAPARLALLQTDPRLRDDLRYSHWGGPQRWLNQPAVFLGGYLCGARELAELAEGAPLYHDDRPVLAYAASAIQPDQRTEAVFADALRPHLGPIAAAVTESLPDSVVQVAASVRERNLRDLAAGAILRSVEGRQAKLGPQAALTWVDEALRLNPENAIAQRMRADALALAGRPADAEPNYREALRLRDDDLLARRGLASVLLSTGKPREAAELLRVVVTRQPNDAAARNALGAALAQLGDLDGAIREFETALRLTPNDEGARQNLARAREAKRGR